MILNKVKAYYDKIIAFAVFAVLVASLLYLAVQLGMISAKEQEFKRHMSSFKMSHAHAGQMDTERFDIARKGIFDPYVIDNTAWLNSPMFVVDQRFWCESCEMPVPWDAKICPLCGNEIKEDPNEDPYGDMDGDGLTYATEVAHGMDPNDPTDAHLDFDGDGFTNFEELTAVPPTDPRDPNSMPPVEQKLKIDKLGVNPFKLRFKSHISLPNDAGLKFGLNLQRRGQSPSTYFRKLEEEVDGFKLIKYEEKIIDDAVIGKRDVSELTLQRGTRTIVLVKGQDIQHNEFLVRFYFQPENLTFVKSPSQTFKLKEKSYKVISVDIEAQSVVIQRLSDNVELTIRKIAPIGETN